MYLPNFARVNIAQISKMIRHQATQAQFAIASLRHPPIESQQDLCRPSPKIWSNFQ